MLRPGNRSKYVVHFDIPRDPRWWWNCLSFARVSSTGGCRGEASPPNPPASPPQCFDYYNVCVSIIIALTIKFWVYFFVCVHW